jgi:hypothetical protein
LKKIFVATQTFNRPIVAQTCLSQQVSVLGDNAQMHVWDDASEFKPDLSGLNLSSYTQLKLNVGPGNMRLLQIKAFLLSDCDRLYFTDSDAVLDPQWLHICFDLESCHPRVGVICLYRSLFHENFGFPIQKHNNIGYRIAEFAPGISYWIKRETIEKAANIGDISESWDFVLPKRLGVYCATTNTSYVDHYGAGGIHTPKGQWDRDRALKPTKYLSDMRKKILPILKQKETNESY